MSKDQGYLFAVGKKAAERLHILNSLFEKTSQKLLHDAGIKKNMSVLEIGCGIGHMTSWLAKEVGNSGTVFACDISGEQLKLAKQKAKAAHLTNIEFIESCVYDLKDLPPVDLIYARFVLIHLPEPFQALQHIIRFLKPGAYIVCEESSNTVSCCYPPSDTYQKYRNWLLALGERKGLDLSLGDKLYSYFRQLDLQDIALNFIQPIYKNKEEKRLIPLLFKEIQSNLLGNGIASRQELNQVLQDIQTFIENDAYLVSYSRITQIYACSI